MTIEKILFTKEEVLYEKIKLITRILDNPNNLDEITKELLDEVLAQKDDTINQLRYNLFEDILDLPTEFVTEFKNSLNYR